MNHRKRETYFSSFSQWETTSPWCARVSDSPYPQYAVSSLSLCQFLQFILQQKRFCTSYTRCLHLHLAFNCCIYWFCLRALKQYPGDCAIHGLVPPPICNFAPNLAWNFGIKNKNTQNPGNSGLQDRCLGGKEKRNVTGLCYNITHKHTGIIVCSNISTISLCLHIKQHILLNTFSLLIKLAFSALL